MPFEVQSNLYVMVQYEGLGLNAQIALVLPVEYVIAYVSESEDAGDTKVAD